MDYINEEVIRYHVFEIVNANKKDIKYKYDHWRASIISFMSYAKTVYDDPEYADIRKLSLTTSVHISLIRLSAESQEIEEFDNPQHDKDIFQSLTLVIRRGEKLPTVNVILKKNVRGFRNNVKFMKFDKHVKALKNLYQAIEDLRNAEEKLERQRREEMNAKRHR